MIRLRTLGECIIEVGGEPFTPDFDSLFAALVFLTAERGKPTPRAALSKLLWPCHDEDEGRHCLRQLLYRMRNARIAVAGARDTVWVPDALVVPTFAAAPSAERLVAERDTGTLRLGAFLPGYWPRLSSGLAEWVEQTRTATEARVRRALLEVVRAHRVRGEWDQVESLASHCLHLDPLNEEATFARTEATAMLGNKNDALDILDRYIDELSDSRPEQLTPAVVLRRRIAERFPSRNYATRSDQCFVGRAESLEVLTHAFGRARAGQGNGLIFTGASGIGKTRLTQEFARAASMQGARIVRVTTQESDRHRPMSAFADAVPQLRALPGAIGISPDSVGFLARLTDPTPPGQPAEEPVDPHWVATRIRQSVVDLVDAVTVDNSVLLIVEDVHWLDTQSWAALAAICDGIAHRKLLLVLTSRDSYPTPDTPHRCVAQLRWCALSPLDADPAGQLVRAVAAANSYKITPEDVAWCVGAGEGNPLLVRELALHCVAGGARGAIPPSLAALLDSRLGSLSETSRRLVDVITVADGVATLDELAEILQLTAYEMANALAEVSEQGLLSDDSPTAELRHTLTKIRFRQLIPSTVRRLFHRRTAKVLSRGTFVSPAADRLLAAAAHWEAAGDSGEAVRLLMRSAAVVEPLGALAESQRLLEAATNLCSGEQIRHEILRRLANVYSWDGAWEKAIGPLQELQISTYEDADKNTRAYDTLLLLDAQFRTGTEATALLKGYTELAKSISLSVRTRLLAGRKVLTVASNYALPIKDLQIWSFIDSIAPVDTDNNLNFQTLQLMRSTAEGDVTAALLAAHAVKELAILERRPFQRTESMLLVGEAFRALGMFEEARSTYEFMQSEAVRLDMSYMRMRAVERLALMHANSGNIKETRTWFSLYSQLSAHSSEKWNRVALLGVAAKLALLEDRLDEANKCVRNYRAEVGEADGVLPWLKRDLVTLAAEVELTMRPSQLPPELESELQKTHEFMRGCLLHDRTAEVLAHALARRGDVRLAHELLTSYIEHDRISAKAWATRIERLNKNTTRGYEFGETE